MKTESVTVARGNVVAGVAALLDALEPPDVEAIERVTLTDKDPWENATYPATHFGWWCESELINFNTESDLLPLPLMLCMDSDKRRRDKLIADRFNSDEMRGVILFEDRDTARDALSRACVTYGRELAGLSALTRSETK